MIKTLLRSEDVLEGRKKARAQEHSPRLAGGVLLAEEIRTEADGFASPSAKDTMLFAARTLERMAQVLEQRLEQSRQSD
jgi:hypothetical protein